MNDHDGELFCSYVLYVVDYLYMYVLHTTLPHRSHNFTSSFTYNKDE